MESLEKKFNESLNHDDSGNTDKEYDETFPSTKKTI